MARWMTVCIISLCMNGSMTVTPAHSAQNEEGAWSKFTSEKDGKAEVRCACVAGKDGCTAQFFWKVSGAEQKTWWQDVFVQAGKEVDLSLACHRKRNVDKFGEGACCDDALTDEEIHRLYGAIEIREP